MDGRRWRASGSARRPTAPGSTPSAVVPASRWSCFTSSTWSGIPTATATRGFVTSTAAGLSAGACPCAKSTAPARSASIDYAGQKPRLIDPTTGEVIELELFVAALGASNYTYA
jgi:hypothetical protein